MKIFICDDSDFAKYSALIIIDCSCDLFQFKRFLPKIICLFRTVTSVI